MVSDSNIFSLAISFWRARALGLKCRAKETFTRVSFLYGKTSKNTTFSIRQVSQRGVTLWKSTTVLPPGNISSTTIFGERAEVD